MPKIAGAAIRHFRKKAGVTLKGLAAETHIPYGTINAWELDPDRLNPDNKEHKRAVALIAKALACTPDDIWNYNAGPDDLEEAIQTFLFDTSLDSSLPKHHRDQARALLARLIS